MAVSILPGPPAAIQMEVCLGLLYAAGHSVPGLCPVIMVCADVYVEG
ncbi:MAG: hypothetical protein ACXVYV_01545 [Gaiellales bacterium]